MIQRPAWRPLSEDRHELVALLEVPEGYTLRTSVLSEAAVVTDDYGNVVHSPSDFGSVLRVCVERKVDE